jgi:putative membrane protein insertion efficiency factor
MRPVLLALLAVYRHAISPFLRPACRFYPSCSAYAAEAVRRHGAARGTLLSVKRLVRCHPLCEGGVDFVP